MKLRGRNHGLGSVFDAKYLGVSKAKSNRDTAWAPFVLSCRARVSHNFFNGNLGLTGQGELPFLVHT